MKKTIYIVVIIAVAIVALYYANRDAGDASKAELRGRVQSIDLEQAMADGPYVVVIEDEDGAEQTIHVPSMGLPLCAAKDAIAHPSELALGDVVEVRGTVTAEGTIVPCESPEHYLRKVQ